MTSTFTEAIALVRHHFGSSSVLQQFGYAEHDQELFEKTELLPAKCRFCLYPSGTRRLVVDFCYSPNGNHFFTIEVFNPLAEDSFLLDEWLNWKGDSTEPYPFILSSYAGSQEERLAGFVSFLERSLTSVALATILDGRDWAYIPFNWGALK